MPQTISTSNLGKALRSLQQLITTYQAICNSMLVLTNPVIRSVETRSRACSDPQLLVSFGKILNFSRAESSDQTSAQQSEAQQQVNYLAMTAKLAAKSIKLPRDLSSLEQATNFIERQFTARSEMLSIEIIEALTSQLTQIDWPQELAEQAKHEFQASLDNLSLALLLDKLDPSDQPHHISLSLLLSYLLATFKPTAEPPYILADIIAHCSTLAVLSTNEFLLSPVLDKLIKLPITNDFFKAVSQLFQTKIAQLATVPFTSKLRSSFRPNFQQQLLRLLAAANKLLGDSYNLEQLRELYNLSRLCKLSTSIGDLLVHNVTSRTEALFGTDNTLLGQFKLLLAVEAVNRATVKHVTFCSTLSLGIEHLLGKKGLKFNLSKTHSEWSLSLIHI